MDAVRPGLESQIFWQMVANRIEGVGSNKHHLPEKAREYLSFRSERLVWFNNGQFVRFRGIGRPEVLG